MTDAVSWTEERVELLKRLWGDGLSASQIAAQIGGVSRNAVIGKVHRLGLSGRVKAAAPPAPARPRVKPGLRPPGLGAPPLQGAARPAEEPAEAPERLPAPQAETAAEVAVPLSQRVTIMELRESMCRWPLGDPTSPEFRFCGARAITGLPYCTHHAAVAYQPVADRKRNDRRFAMRA